MRDLLREIFDKTIGEVQDTPDARQLAALKYIEADLIDGSLVVHGLTPKGRAALHG